MGLYDYKIPFRMLDMMRVLIKKLLTKLRLRDRQSCAYCGRDQWVVWHSDKWKDLPDKWHDESLCIECYCALYPGVLFSDDIVIITYNTNSHELAGWQEPSPELIKSLIPAVSIAVCHNCGSKDVVEFLGKNRRQCQICGNHWQTEC